MVSLFYDEEAQFIKDYLSPALTEAHIMTKILAYDYPWVNLSYPRALLDDPAIGRSIGGISLNRQITTAAGRLQKPRRQHRARSSYYFLVQRIF